MHGLYDLILTDHRFDLIDSNKFNLYLFISVQFLCIRFLTAFGKIVYDARRTVESALTSYWKLRAIDSLEMSNELPKEEQQKLIDALLDNQEIKGILVKGSS